MTTKKEIVDAVAAKLDEAGVPYVRGDGAGAAQPRQQTFGFDPSGGFLGEEFLTWLWFKWETDGGEFHVSKDRVIGVVIDDLLQFAPHSEQEHEQIIRHGMPTRTAEARQGLRQGHRLAKARLMFAEGARQWSLVIDAEHMAFASVKLPDNEEEECESPADRTSARTVAWIDLYEIVGMLFRQFLSARVSPNWISCDAVAMAEWMAE